MKLYCIRHGEALSSSENPGRPLSIKGQQDAKQMGAYLAQCGIQIPHIVHSPAERTKETANWIAEHMEGARVVEMASGLLESDPLDIVLDELPTWHEDTLIVGHLPYLSQLVSQLVTHQPDLPLVKFSPATMVCLELHQAQRWIINWVMSPQLLIPETASENTRDMF